MNKWMLLMGSALLLACKPTPRTAVDAHQAPPHAEQESALPQEQEKKPEPAREAAEAPVGLLHVTVTRQEYNRLRPWEKKAVGKGSYAAVYIGQGRALTVAAAAHAATYIELSLPDHSRTAAAKAIKYDEELGLALLTVEHQEDAAIFDKMPMLTVGEPLRPGDEAQLWAAARGLAPVQTEVEVESANDEAEMPLLDVRSAKPLPLGVENGLPIMRDGRLCALVKSHSSREQALTCINAEFIRRFLEEGSIAGLPTLGVVIAPLDDSVFARYLKLDAEQGGVYVSKTLPAGAAEKAGICRGDVITSIDGLPLDRLGRAQHPLYGLLEAPLVIRSLKPMGERLTLGISRSGEQREVQVELNRDAVQKGLLAQEPSSVPPRYVMWGGLLFQPLSATYLEDLKEHSGSLPLPLLELQERLPELMAQGRREIVALTLVIPTPATLGYDTLGFCMVEAVNGRQANTFAEFAELLDAPTEDGIVELSINRPPYKIYLDRKTVEQTNDAMRRRAIPTLRRLTIEKTAEAL